MDPGRRAMIEGQRPGSVNRDITSPRRDANTRISKPSRPAAHSSSAHASQRSAANADRYLSQDEQSQKFAADEDKFVLRQSKKKADIRVREGRAKPIDFLAFNLRFIDPDRDVFDDDDGDASIDAPAPETVIQGLDDKQLRQLEEDIASYYTLEANDRNQDYWRALRTLAKDRRQRLGPRAAEGRTVGSVSSDIDKILSPKTYEQLAALEKQIRAKLDSDETIDTDYWEELLKSLLVYKAKAKLSKIYESIRAARNGLLGRGDDSDEAGAPDAAAESSAPSGRTTAATSSRAAVGKAPFAALASDAASSTAPPPGTARFAQPTADDFSQATKALYEREVARGVGEDEEIFTAEETVPSAAKPLWADKYRPRKPRYFNRVQMGYEWNKYNQTHYDHDNPPPKVVQGYKFNIFYPDLIDKQKAPTYKIVREGGRRRGESFAPAGEEDTCLIRFVAGPPYEDIAFRIVDREWDFSAKRDRGFRSSFDKGILQLHFQFKKIYYRK